MFNQKPGIIHGIFYFVIGIAFVCVGLYFGVLKNQSKESTLTSIQNSLASTYSSSEISYAPSPMLQLQVEVLDSNNPPKYVLDYLACQKTSPTKQLGTMIENSAGQLEYKCPKSLEYYGCKEYKGNNNLILEKLIWRGEEISEEKFRAKYKTWFENKMENSVIAADFPLNEVLSYLQLKNGWSCNTLFAGGREDRNCMFAYNIPFEDLGIISQLNENVDPINAVNGCVVILKQELKPVEIVALKNFKSPQGGKLKLVTIKN